jgi:glycosyltransferase involved in cell wall biosynthesis
MRKISYLSAAPRVSTSPNCEASGPRSHVLGIIRAFEALGWDVKQFIVGDRLPVQVTQKGSEKFTSGSILKTLAIDIARLIMGVINSRRAWKEVGIQTEWVYERFAVLQTLGWTFKRKNIPWILETNAPLFYEAKFERKSLILTGIAKKIEFFAYRNCDVLICVTEALKEIIVQSAHIHPDKVLVVPNGVDTSYYDPAKHTAKRFFSSITIGFVGSVIHWQSLDLLLHAVKQLSQQGIQINVVIVGDGPARKEWEQLSINLNLASQVRFTGRISSLEVPSYVAGMDICFSGQRPMQIGVMYLSPLKLYEYMAMGKPVIASSFSDANKLIEGKRTGFLFEPGNLEGLINVLKAAVESQDDFPEMGVLARKEIMEKHSWESRIQMVIPQIESILNHQKREYSTL